MEVLRIFKKFTEDWPIINKTIREFHSELDSIAARSWIAAVVQMFISASKVFSQHVSFYAFALSVFVTSLMYYYIFRPADYFKDHSYPEHEKSSRKLSKSAWQQCTHALQNKSRMKDIPPVYPNGWFAILESSDVQRNKVKYVAALGENLAVFRKSDGKIHVVDAYCPHLGANMGIGGVVKNDCLECPFHGWQFDGETGKCTTIPYADKIPEFAKVRTWRSCEVNHFIFVWYHAEGDEPTYEPQPIKEIMNGEYRFLGRSEHVLGYHLQDSAENLADNSHLNFVHGSLPLTQSYLRNRIASLLSSYVKVHFNSTWKPNVDLPHEALVYVAIHIHIFNKPRFRIGEITGKCVGPSLIEMNILTPFGPLKVINCTTPFKPLKQRLIQRVYGPLFASFIGRYYFLSESETIEQDSVLLKNKKYEANPILLKEDESILDHRSWFSQFYSKNSPRFEFQDEFLEW